MVGSMHYSGTVMIENHGPQEVRRAVGAGQHLTTLAFSEAGSRSHFWKPSGTATESAWQVRLDASKSWVTAAGEASSYVWSSRPLAAEGGMTLWLVPADAAGLSEPGKFDGLGLRGNRSAPIGRRASSCQSRQCWNGRRRARPGAGRGLPWFLILSAAFSVGVMETVTAGVGAHIASTRLEHLDQTLADQPLIRVDHARMRVWTDQAAALLADTLAAVEAERDDAVLRVLEVKAAAGEAAIAVTDLADVLWGCRLPQGARYRALVPRCPGRSGHGAHDRRPARFRRAR